MLDIALIRAQPDEVKQRLARLHDPDALARVDRILELDAQRRELLNASESLQAKRNQLNAPRPVARQPPTGTEVAKPRMQEAARLVESTMTRRFPCFTEDKNVTFLCPLSINRPRISRRSCSRGGPLTPDILS